MPVVTDITALSTTAGSNSPAGSESIGTNADDYLRQMHAFIATLRDGSTNIALGTVGAPSLRPVGGATTGIYWPSTSQFAVSISGTQRFLTSSTGITVPGASRIKGDLSNVTQANRLLFQTSTANSSCSIGSIPDGSGTSSGWNAFALSDPDNSPFFQLISSSTVASLNSGKLGTGVTQAIRIAIDGAEAIGISTGRNVSVAAAASGVSLTVGQVSGSSAISVTQTGTSPALLVAATSANAVAAVASTTTSGDAFYRATTSGVQDWSFGAKRSPNEFWITPVSDLSAVTSGIAVTSAGALRIGAAASQIVPGATSFSVRNNLNSADNVLVSDAGLMTIRDDLRVLGDQVIFSADGTTTNEHLVWSRSSTESRLTVSTGGLTDLSIMNLVATDGINATYQVNGTSVVTSRRTGWAAATGTATRTTFATGTVTTAQLAERVKALIDDLITHGLIGA